MMSCTKTASSREPQTSSRIIIEETYIQLKNVRDFVPWNDDGCSWGGCWYSSVDGDMLRIREASASLVERAVLDHPGEPNICSAGVIITAFGLCRASAPSWLAAMFA
jgi:hypothetical protein